MIDLTLIILGKENNKKSEDKNIEMIYTDGSNLNQIIDKSKGKYLAFIKEEDKISENYLKKITDQCKKEFDCCFINYKVEYNYKNEPKIATEGYELSKYKPYYGDFLWAYIFKKEKLIKVLKYTNSFEFNDAVNKEFANTTLIKNVIYYHNPSSRRIIKDFPYSDVKRNDYSKNIIYIGTGCNGTFNGYISWLKNIGRCFDNKYKITFLYDEANSQTLKAFSKFFRCVKRNPGINYTCDRLLTTYSDYYYPKNIFALDENYLFIHGNMCDYPNTRVFTEDIYTKYIGVSKISAVKAKGYFPTDNIDYVLNPFKLDKTLAKPHMTLTSAFRYSDIKRPERVEKMAKLLSEMEIPYTWNLFTDKRENTNDTGLIFRNRVANPIPYVKDSDYFVLLSDSEAMPYCVLEALAVNTKVVLTPLEAYDELGINKKNATIIPFNYFDDGNEDKLKKVIRKMYKEKDKKVKYKIDKKLWQKYNDIFKD